jgi:SWI/SNF-related matrix-associated actin-dependent regulator 1 of chromatin subfamily A
VPDVVTGEKRNHVHVKRDIVSREERHHESVIEVQNFAKQFGVYGTVRLPDGPAFARVDARNEPRRNRQSFGGFLHCDVHLPLRSVTTLIPLSNDFANHGPRATHEGMSLRFNVRTGDYVISTIQTVKATDTGLTLSKTATGPNGEPIYFTKDPYAALNFYREADRMVVDKLAPLWTDYEASWATESPNKYPIGQYYADLGGLRGYQNAAIDYALRRKHTLIGDAPGVGKTLTAIGACNAFEARKVLVVCPAAIRGQWKKEIKKGSTIEKVSCYPVIRSADGIATWPHFTIISYDLLRNPAIHAALCSINWNAIILDEAHALKEVSARRTQALFGGGRREEFKDVLADHADRILALTGTPLPNRPRECYTLTRAMCWEAINYMSADDFRYRFNPSATLATGAIREEKGRLPELQARLRCNFMVRRLKEDVLKDLPDKTYEFAYIEKDGRIADVIQREKMLNYTIADLKKPNVQMFGEISTIRREMGEAKVPQTIQHIRFLLDIMEVQKLVVFSHHKSVMNALKENLEEYGVVEVRGGMGDAARRQSILRFAGDLKEKIPCDPKVRIFSAQLEAGGVGIDGLQDVCTHCVIVEPAWTSGSNEQAIDRLHRSGQHGNVIAQFIVVEGSLDEKILATVIDKVHTVHEALDNRKSRPI